MDNYNPSNATNEQTTEFVESLFVMGSDTPTTTKPLVATKPEPIKAAAAKEPAAELSEKSGDVGQITIVPLSEIDHFPAHPFQIRDDDEIANLVESIKNYGLLTPL